MCCLFTLFLHLCSWRTKDPPQTALHPFVFLCWPQIYPTKTLRQTTIILEQPTRQKSKTAALFYTNCISPPAGSFWILSQGFRYHRCFEICGASGRPENAIGHVQRMQRNLMAIFLCHSPGGDGRCLVIKPVWTMDGALLGVCLRCSASPRACHSWLPFRLHLRKSFKMSRWIYIVDSYGLVPIWCI